MKLLLLIRLVIFILIAPVIAIVMAFIFILPYNIDIWFSEKRRDEARNVCVKLWNWVGWSKG